MEPLIWKIPYSILMLAGAIKTFEDFISFMNLYALTQDMMAKYLAMMAISITMIFLLVITCLAITIKYDFRK